MGTTETVRTVVFSCAGEREEIEVESEDWEFGPEGVSDDRI